MTMAPRADDLDGRKRTADSGLERDSASAGPTEDDAFTLMVTALHDAGAPRVEAALVACLLTHPDADTGHLLKVTGLRQPEVSTGMRELRDRGWVHTEAKTRAGRGRPMHGHSLDATPENVREHYAQAVRARIAGQQGALDGLQALVDHASERTPSRSARMTASQRPRNRPQSTTPG
jgi:predicted transcriptional regulator